MAQTWHGQSPEGDATLDSHHQEPENEKSRGWKKSLIGQGLRPKQTTKKDLGMYRNWEPQRFRKQNKDKEWFVRTILRPSWETQNDWSPTFCWPVQHNFGTLPFCCTANQVSKICRVIAECDYQVSPYGLQCCKAMQHMTAGAPIMIRRLLHRSNHCTVVLPFVKP